MNADAALPLVLMTLGAVAMPSVARSVGIPVAIAEIVYGFVIGGSGLGLAGEVDNPFTAFLAELGFSLFLFLAGLEVDFRVVQREGPRRLVLQIVGALASFLLAGIFVTFRGGSLWIVLAVGATSVPLLLAVVRELRLGSTALGVSMVTTAAVGEVVTVLLLSGAEIAEHAADAPAAVIGFLRMLALVGAVLFGAAILRLLLWWFPAPFRRMVQGDDPSEFGVRTGFGLMFVMIGLARLAGIEPVLGAFLAGLMLGYVVREKGALEHKLSSMAYGFFVPVFFIHVGMRLDLGLASLWANAGLIAQIVVAMFVVKLIPQLLTLFAGRRFREVIATSALLAAPLTLVIAIVDLGARSGAVGPDTEAAVITAGVLASVAFPSLARRVLRPT